MAQQAQLLRWDGRTARETPACRRRVARVSAWLIQEQVRHLKHLYDVISDLVKTVYIMKEELWKNEL